MAMKPQEWVVCMAMDAFRVCIGMRPRNFTRAEIVRWINAQSLEGK